MLDELESPQEVVRLAALQGLAGLTSLAALRAVRRAAMRDPSARPRFEARKLLAAAESGVREELPPPGRGELAPSRPPEASTLSRTPESTLRRLCFDLRHDSAEVRAATAARIATVPDARLLGPLRELLRDEDPAVRHAARQAVRTVLHACAPAQGDAAELELFRAELEASPNQAMRAVEQVVEVSLRAGLRPAAEVLARRLSVERHPFVRANLLTALSLLGDVSTAKLMRPFLRDPDARVRANAVDALHLAGDEADREATVPLLADPDPRVRAAAVRPSLAIYPEPFLTQLRALLFSPNVPERSAGLYVVRTVRIPERLELLREHFVRETEPRLYEAAAGALAHESSQERSDRPREPEISGEPPSVPAHGAADCDGLTDPLGAGVGRPELEAGGRQPLAPRPCLQLELTRFCDQLQDEDKRRCLQAAMQAVTRSAAPAEEMAPVSAPARVEESQEEAGTFTQVLDLRQQGLLGPAELRERLAAARDPIVICTLLEAVAEARLPDGVDLVAPLASLKDRRVRLAAAAALGRLELPGADELLGALLKDAEPEVAARARDELIRFGPGPVMACARALLETRTSVFFRRGLELLEKLGDRSALPLALEAIGQGGPPGSVEPMARLVLAWGDAETLERLQRGFEEAPVNARPFLAELGLVLGRKLGLGRTDLARRFPHESVDLLAALEGRSSATRPSANPLATPPSRPGVNRRWPAALAAAALAAWLLVPPEEVPRPPAPAARPPRETAAPSGTHISLEEAPAVAQAGPSFVSIPVVDTSPRAIDPPPTLEEVEAALGNALAAQGVRSAALVHMLALDRLQDGCRVELARAQEALGRGDPAAAIRILDALLAQLDPENLTARLEVLQALERAGRQGRRFERMPQWRAELRDVEKSLANVLLQAAREAGLPQEQVRAALEALENSQKSKAALGTAADFFSGARLAEPLPEEPDDLPPLGVGRRGKVYSPE